MTANGTGACQVAANGVGPRDELNVAADTITGGNARPGELLASRLVRRGRRIVSQTVSENAHRWESASLSDQDLARSIAYAVTARLLEQPLRLLQNSSRGDLGEAAFLLGLDSPDSERRVAQRPDNHGQTPGGPTDTGQPIDADPAWLFLTSEPMRVIAGAPTASADALI
jgi:hypothetical protein